MDWRRLFRVVTEEVPELGAITPVLALFWGGTQAAVFLQAQLSLTLWKMGPFLDHPHPDRVAALVTPRAPHTQRLRKSRGLGQWDQRKKGSQPRVCRSSLSFAGLSPRAVLSSMEATKHTRLLSTRNAASPNGDTWILKT